MLPDRIRSHLGAWRALRNTCAESDIYQTDAAFAEEVGLPVLAALCEVLDRVQQAHGPISPREIEAELRPVLNVAICEANERLRIVLEDPNLDGAPGVPVIPGRLLEREARRQNSEKENSDEIQNG